MKLSECLESSSINLHLTGQRKEQVIAELVDILVASGRIKRRDPLIEALLEREGLGSTGIGHGVAIPHTRSSELSLPAAALGRSEHEVDFDSIDGEPTRLFFLVIAPDNGTSEHLHLLAKIARLVKDAKTRQRLMTAQTPQEVVELLRLQEGL